MSALSDKLRAARTLRIPAGKFVFLALRPTPIEYQQKLRGGDPVAGFLALLIGWENVSEGDLLAGGDPHPLPFDAAACAEWLGDRPDLFNTVVEAIITAYQDYARALEDAAKN